jgi:DNA-binding transcriptional MocR family regulator
MTAERAASKRQRRRRTRIGGAFTPRLCEMLESPAYRVLSRSALQVLARLEIELCHHRGADNGRLPVTYQQFQEYGMDRNCIAPAIRELEALGFLEVTERGRAGNAEFRAPNLFRLTYSNTSSREDPTHEWRRTTTMADAKEIARRARNPKQNSSRGFSHVSEGKTPTENQISQ